MRKHPVAVAIAFVVLAFVSLSLVQHPVEGQSGAASTAAVSTERGGQDVFGAYDVAQWPKPLSTLPGHETWTWGAGQYVFAESPNRVFVLQRGELPVIKRPQRAPHRRLPPPARRPPRKQGPEGPADSAPADRSEHRVPDVPPAAPRCHDSQ